MKSIITAALAALILTGCVTAQEREELSTLRAECLVGDSAACPTYRTAAADLEQREKDDQATKDFLWSLSRSSGGASGHNHDITIHIINGGTGFYALTY